jgi:ABC-type transporter Mla subunit MlaD
VFWLAVLVTVAFTIWRLLANLKALLASVQALGERLTPALEELAAAGEEAAERAARLQARGAEAAEDDGAGPRHLPSRRRRR